MTATATDERLSKVTLRRGFNFFLITLDQIGDRYEVGACRLYSTYQGLNVEGTKERTFTDLDEARQYANGYYYAMRKRGWDKTADI